MPDIRIGIDTSKLPSSRGEDRGVHEVLETAAAIGCTGVLFRSVLELDPGLDHGAIAEVRAHADELDLYIEAGIAKVNPYMTAELPEIRALGDGDYLRALERMVAACAAAGVTELWTATAAWKRRYPGIFQYDRFRTDAPWHDQLAAIERLLLALRPTLLRHGVHLNVETHEEITSFEVIRLVEAVGPDVLGVTFDIANVVVRGEDPVAAAQRCRQYLRMCHLRDLALWPTPTGFDRYVAPFGSGVVDWDRVFPVLAGSPLRMWTIEGLEPGGQRSRKPVDVRDQRWLDGHPDLVDAELHGLAALAAQYADVAARGVADGVEELDRPGDPMAFLTSGLAFLGARSESEVAA
ncbi:TIM barrel protein [Nocardia sp. NPDC024068]|uniref:sugar phosphate isomerase/epimerase family protein n=1 Tax=Nocardia sp. NPDC024068 TaxID=3157197 RepID=UPI0033F7EEE3